MMLTQGLCGVCAPGLGYVEGIARLLPRTPAIESFDPHRLEDVLENVLRVGRGCGIAERAGEMVAALQERIDRVAGRTSTALARPKTVCLEWLEPLFFRGHWIP